MCGLAMRFIRRAVLAVPLVLLAASLAAGQLQTPPASRTGSLRGRVLDGMLGTGIAGVTIVVDGRASTTTDSTGAYRLRGLTPGTRILALSSFGYDRAPFRGRRRSGGRQPSRHQPHARSHATGRHCGCADAGVAHARAQLPAVRDTGERRDFRRSGRPPARHDRGRRAAADPRCDPATRPRTRTIRRVARPERFGHVDSRQRPRADVARTRFTRGCARHDSCELDSGD